MGLFTFQLNVLNTKETEVSEAKLTYKLSEAVDKACEDVGIDPKLIKIEVMSS